MVFGDPCRIEADVLGALDFCQCLLEPLSAFRTSESDFYAYIRPVCLTPEPPFGMYTYTSGKGTGGRN